MKRVLPLLVCLSMLPGCLASIGVQVGNTSAPATQPSVGPRGSISSSAGGISAHVSDGSTLGALIGIGVLGAMFGGDRRSPPELDPSRRVHTQDCTRPLEVPEANLRCQ